jgi:hypothetical protein
MSYEQLLILSTVAAFYTQLGTLSDISGGGMSGTCFPLGNKPAKCHAVGSAKKKKKKELK